jgi:SAM-dependent methyltransferase
MGIAETKGTDVNTDPIGETGNFGALVGDYGKGRLPMPPITFKYLNYKSEPFRGFPILDVGCGEGLNTCLLGSSLGRTVIGVDANDAMVAAARERQDCEQVSFMRAAAQDLPFANGEFGLVTTFGSFHWWYDKPGALDSVHRVLQVNGTFAVINKDDARSDRPTFRQEVVDIIRDFSASTIHQVKFRYDPVETLRGDDDRWEVTYIKPDHVDTWSNMDDVLSHIRSMSVWHYVPEDRRPEATEAMRAHFEPQMHGGMFHRPVVITIVCAKKR